MNVIFTCGGTGGHINPAIAVANALKERHPDANILFLGAIGEMEENLVPRAGFSIKTVHCAGFCREFSMHGIKWNMQAIGVVRRAVKRCRQIIAEFKPDVIVGTGGYASYPAMKAGVALGVPVLVHEANAVPGLTTKMAAGKASKVLVAYEESARYYRQPEKVEVVGMPVRREFITTNKAEARARFQGSFIACLAYYANTCESNEFCHKWRYSAIGSKILQGFKHKHKPCSLSIFLNFLANSFICHTGFHKFFQFSYYQSNFGSCRKCIENENSLSFVFGFV